MKFAVIPIYERGRHLSEAEVRRAVPLIGDLRIHQVSDIRTCEYRREAILIADGDTYLIRPLLDPELDGMSVLAFGLLVL